jgi:hypothetical protein
MIDPAPAMIDPTPVLTCGFATATQNNILICGHL